MKKNGFKIMIDPYFSNSVEKLNSKNYRRIEVDESFFNIKPNAATLQLAACSPNFSILEIMYSDVEWRKDVTNESLEYKDGYITIPDKPGLGIEINEEECLKHPYQPHTLRHYTGALTDIRPAKTEFYF